MGDRVRARSPFLFRQRSPDANRHGSCQQSPVLIVHPAMRLRTVILDDSAPDRAELAGLLRTEGDVDLIGEGPTGVDSLHRVRQLRPDLLFLQAGADAGTSLPVLTAAWRDGLPAVVVTAASPQHALAAFDAQALDYLLKPYQPGRLQRSLQRAREHVRLRQDSRVSPERLRLLEDLESAPQYLTRVAVKDRSRVFFVPVDAIEWVEAADNYILLHVGKDRHILRQTMSGLEARLNPDRFVRLSRSVLINLAFLTELRPLFKGEYVALLRDGSRLPISRPYEEIEQLLKFS